MPGPRSRPAGATSGRRGLGLAVLLVEALDPTLGVHELLLPREERMARRADLDVDRGHGGAGLDDIAAGAGNDGLLVLRMNAFPHGGRSVLTAAQRRCNPVWPGAGTTLCGTASGGAQAASSGVVWSTMAWSARVTASTCASRLVRIASAPTRVPERPSCSSRN